MKHPGCEGAGFGNNATPNIISCCEAPETPDVSETQAETDSVPALCLACTFKNLTSLHV